MKKTLTELKHWVPGSMAEFTKASIHRGLKSPIAARVPQTQWILYQFL